MLIEKFTMSFYNPETKEIDEHPVYKISYRSLMVMEEDLVYAFKKMIMYAVQRKVLKVK